MASATASSILERVIEIMPLNECSYVGRHACYELKYKYKGVSYAQYVYVKSKATPLENWFPLPWAHPLLVPTEDIALPVYQGGSDQPAFYVGPSAFEFWRGNGGMSSYIATHEYTLGDEYASVRRCKCFNYRDEYDPGRDCYQAGIYVVDNESLTPPNHLWINSSTMPKRKRECICRDSDTWILRV
jgi:hypothetical protein